MRIPKKIKLYGEEFKILQVSKEDLKCATCEDDCLGKLIWSEKLIYIAIDDDENAAEDILLHELGHYFAYHYELGKSEIIADAFAKFVKKIILDQLIYDED